MMNKTEFLAALRHELGFLPKDELDDAIRYYDEYINDAGDDEEKVIAEMGTPHKVAEEFKNEYYDRKTLMMKVQNTITKFLGKQCLYVYWRLGLAYLY